MAGLYAAGPATGGPGADGPGRRARAPATIRSQPASSSAGPMPAGSPRHGQAAPPARGPAPRSAGERAPRGRRDRSRRSGACRGTGTVVPRRVTGSRRRSGRTRTTALVRGRPPHRAPCWRGSMRRPRRPAGRARAHRPATGARLGVSGPPKRRSSQRRTLVSTTPTACRTRAMRSRAPCTGRRPGDARARRRRSAIHSRRPRQPRAGGRARGGCSRGRSTRPGPPSRGRPPGPAAVGKRARKSDEAIGDPRGLGLLEHDLADEDARTGRSCRATGSRAAPWRTSPARSARTASISTAGGESGHGRG